MVKDLQTRLSRVTQPYLLRNSFIMTDLPENELNILKKNTKRVTMKRGTVLFKQGAFPTAVFWLNAGKAKIFQGTATGQRLSYYIYSDGDIIGYRQLIAEEPNPTSAVLLEDAEVTVIPSEIFRNMIATSPYFARNVLSALAREFSVWINRMTVFQHFTVRRRLILSLLILLEQYRLSGSPPGMITMTRTELSEYVGASLETVVRILNTLKARKLVEISGRKIFLPDPAALMDILKAEESKN